MVSKGADIYSISTLDIRALYVMLTQKVNRLALFIISPEPFRLSPGYIINNDRRMDHRQEYMVSCGLIGPSGEVPGQFICSL